MAAARSLAIQENQGRRYTGGIGLSSPSLNLPQVFVRRQSEASSQGGVLTNPLRSSSSHQVNNFLNKEALAQVASELSQGSRDIG